MDRSGGVSKLEDAKQGAEASVNTEERPRLREQKRNLPVEKMQAFKDLKNQRERKRKLFELEEEQSDKQTENEGPEYFNGNRPVKKLKGSDMYSHHEVSKAEKHDVENKASTSPNQVVCESQFPISKEELSRIRLSRHKLEMLIHTRFFNKTVVGCFVKVGVGYNSGKEAYRIAEITDVVETAKVYELGKTRTNIGVVTKHGLESRIYRLEFMSNQGFSDEEFSTWKKTVCAQGCSFPTAAHISRKVADIQLAVNRHCSEADVDFIVKQKERFQTNPRNYAKQKLMLGSEKETAEQNGELEISRQLSMKIRDLEKRAKSLDERRTTTISAVNYINIRNRQRNIGKAGEVTEDDQTKETGMAEYDPFTRRRCAPVLVTKKRKPPASADVPKDTEHQIFQTEQVKKENPRDKPEIKASVPAAIL